jgi:uncharacterized protein DUF4158
MESIGANLRQMQRTPLAASHVQALRDARKTVTHPVGAILARSGEPITSFVSVEEGEVEAIDDRSLLVLDGRAIEQRRTAALKLGLALQLGFLRMRGRPLAAAGAVPPMLWRHLGAQFTVAGPLALARCCLCHA